MVLYADLKDGGKEYAAGNAFCLLALQHGRPPSQKRAKRLSNFGWGSRIIIMGVERNRVAMSWNTNTFILRLFYACNLAKSRKGSVMLFMLLFLILQSCVALCSVARDVIPFGNASVLVRLTNKNERIVQHWLHGCCL